MINIKEQIEKDNTNLIIKNIISLEKNTNNIIVKALIFATYKNNKNKVYCIAKVALINDVWKLEIVYNFNDFSEAISKFAKCKKNFLIQNEEKGINLELMFEKNCGALPRL